MIIRTGSARLIKWVVHCIIVLSSIALLAACGPQEGDMYENLLTGERFEIEGIGSCANLAAAYRGAKQTMIETIKENSDIATTELFSMIQHPIMLEEDSLQSCYAFEMAEVADMMGFPVTMRFMYIKPTSELKEGKYKKLN